MGNERKKILNFVLFNYFLSASLLYIQKCYGDRDLCANLNINVSETSRRLLYMTHVHQTVRNTSVSDLCTDVRIRIIAPPQTTTQTHAA